MSSYAVINLKTDPQLKKLAAQVADKLGVSLSAVLNNELRRFATEQSVLFDIPEMPNRDTASILAKSRSETDSGDYNSFDNNDDALEFLSKELA
jgi:addiction module RelB/DinJ family antitoxin